MAEERARISAAEAAARLGVKRATLYAYVSRGLVQSRTLDGKTSTFDPTEIEQLRGRRRGARPGSGDMAVVSVITRIEGHTLSYRGHDVAGLIRSGWSFESVAALLWSGEVEGADTSWRVDRHVLARARVVQDAFGPTAPVIDRLRATVALVSAHDELRGDLGPRSVTRVAGGLIGYMVDALPRVGAASRPTARLADRLWPRLGATPITDAWGDALNAALIALADHDLAPSTLAARVAASARADVYSIVSAGLGPLGGVLHGAASIALHEAFVQAEHAGVTAAAAGLLGHGRAVGGFGHFLYPEGDPRVAMLLPRIRDAANDSRRVARVDKLIALLRDRLELEPNIDCALAALSYLAGMRGDAGEAIFAIARTAGWVAHGLAEMQEPPLRFRPVSQWVG